MSSNVVLLKPTTELTLVLLPPKEPEEVTQKDIENFYKNLACILASEN